MCATETVCVLRPTHGNPLKVSCHYNNSVWAGAGMQHRRAVNNKAHKNTMMESSREDVSLNHRQLRSRGGVYSPKRLHLSLFLVLVG